MNLFANWYTKNFPNTERSEESVRDYRTSQTEEVARYGYSPYEGMRANWFYWFHSKAKSEE